MDLKQLLNESDLKSEIVSFDTKPLSSKNGYMSDIQNLVLHLANGDEVQLIMKSPLKSVEGEDNEMYVTTSQSVNESELKFYNVVYPELRLVLEKLNLRNPFPLCYYAGETTNGPVFIFEDLSCRNLHIPSIEYDLSDENVNAVLKTLAVLQVGAAGLQVEKEKSLLEIFPFLKNPFCHLLQEMVTNRIDICLQYFNEKFPNESKCAQLLRNLAFDEELSEYFFAGKDSDCFLCHGDLWNNNIFIRDELCFLIDWQGASVGLPTGDIACLVVVGMDLGSNPFTRFETLVHSYIVHMRECCEHAELQRFLERKLIPIISNEKCMQLSLQFVIKWIVASWDVFLDSPVSVRDRVLTNTYNILTSSLRSM